MSDSEAWLIAEMLSVNTSLQVLVLSNNKIGAHGITAIAELLQFTALTALDLRGNPISDEGTVVISKHIQRNWKVETLL